MSDQKLLILAGAILGVCAGLVLGVMVLTPEPEFSPFPSTTRPAATAALLPEEEFYPIRLLENAYRPVTHVPFIPAAEAVLDDGETVVGVKLGGQSRAYPITKVWLDFHPHTREWTTKRLIEKDLAHPEKVYKS